MASPVTAYPLRELEWAPSSDGADVGFSHYVGGVDFSDREKIKSSVKVGMRVRTVWKEKREAKIADIEYFAPVG